MALVSRSRHAAAAGVTKTWQGEVEEGSTTCPNLEHYSCMNSRQLPKLGSGLVKTLAFSLRKDIGVLRGLEVFLPFSPQMEVPPDLGLILAEEKEWQRQSPSIPFLCCHPGLLSTTGTKLLPCCTPVLSLQHPS